MVTYDLVSKLHYYTLPMGILPLARQRQPFYGLSLETIAEFIKLTELYPEKVGRLTAAIREPVMTGKEYTVMEAHLDCEAVPINFLNWLIQQGFEPDHFHRFVPECYPDHFTFKVVLPDSMSAERARQLYALLRKLCNRTFAQLEHSSITGYIELEVWQSGWRQEFAYCEPSEMMITQLPYHIPKLQEMQPQDGGYKAADIHIKTPLVVRGSGFEKAESPVMDQLRTALRAIGFYEVVTEAGNKVYTAQFLHMREAHTIYHCLLKYCERFAGGITDITLEPCTGFWRSRSAGLPVPLPPLVVVRK